MRTALLLVLTACTTQPTQPNGPSDATDGNPPAICEAYLECQADAGAPTETLALEFGPGGSCWEDAEVAGHCSAICSDGMTAIQAGPWDGLPTSCLYDVPEWQLVQRAEEVCPQLDVPEGGSPDLYACLAEEILRCRPRPAAGVSACLDETEPVNTAYRPGQWTIDADVLSDPCNLDGPGLLPPSWILQGDGRSSLEIVLDSPVSGGAAIPCSISGSDFDCSPDPAISFSGSFARPGALAGGATIDVQGCAIQVEFDGFFVP